jgi:hypothetical protein
MLIEALRCIRELPHFAVESKIIVITDQEARAMFLWGVSTDLSPVPQGSTCSGRPMSVREVGVLNASWQAL